MKKKIFFYLFFITFSSLLFFFRYFFSLKNYADGEKISLSGKVLSEPTKYKDSQKVSIEYFSFYLPLFPEINYGDMITVEGEVEGERLKKAKLLKIEPGSGIYLFRRKILDFYYRSLPEPHASLVAGMVLGAKSSLPANFWDQLKKTGTAHVVVASGMNVTLVAGFLISLFLLVFERRKAIVFALISIWLYAFISGLDAPIVRAAIMGSIAFSAQALGRLNVAWRSLFISVLLMLLVNPFWIKDLGFLLSFVATASLMLFERKLRPFFRFIPGIFREGLSTSLSAQIGVAPILYFTFGQFSLFSPIINALVLWTVPLITIIGMFTAILCYIYMPLSKVVIWLVYPLTSWFIEVISLF